MGIVTYFIYNLLTNILGREFINEAISLVVSIASGIIVYGIMILLLKVEEIKLIIDKVRNA